MRLFGNCLVADAYASFLVLVLCLTFERSFILKLEGTNMCRQSIIMYEHSSTQAFVIYIIRHGVFRRSNSNLPRALPHSMGRSVACGWIKVEQYAVLRFSSTLSYTSSIDFALVLSFASVSHVDYSRPTQVRGQCFFHEEGVQSSPRQVLGGDSGGR